MDIIFDAHTHIHFLAYDEDREEVIKRARVAGVRMITVGTTLGTSQEAVACAKKYSDMIWATVGFHPSHVGQKEMWHHDKNEQRDDMQEEFDEKALEELAREEKVVAIGECGLDYFRLDSLKLLAEEVSLIKESQKEVFIQQIALAQKLHKPLMIHCRPSKGGDDAYEDLLVILNKVKNLSVDIIIHFYVGSLTITEKLIERGCFFTFGGVVTFVRDYDESIKRIPLEKIMLETDAPYVAPVPYRGKRNEPVYVVEVAKKIAQIKGLDYETVVEQTTRNAQSIFKVLQ